MPTSFDHGKPQIRAYLLANYTPQTRVLDVGPGCGTYQKLLGDHFPTMDAVEVHEPYVDKFHLEKLYSRIYIQSVEDFQAFGEYGLVIMGDVLEHLSVDGAQKVLSRIPKATGVMIAVPFKSKQGAHRGVQSEIHLQDDLTPELFDQRYPGFEAVFSFKENRYTWGAYYHRVR